MEFQVAAELERESFESNTVQAYQTVRVWAMTRAKKRLPRLDDVLPKPKHGKTQTVQEMRAAMSYIAKQYGNKMRVSTRVIA